METVRETVFRSSPTARAVITDPDIVVRRPLYLGLARGASVDLDGPALLVRAPGRAAVRYPLGRVSRIISHIGVQWCSSALAACLERGIPIIITRPGDGLLGHVLPAVRAPAWVDCDLQEFLDRPDWRDHYANWLRAERMRILAEWRRRRVAQGTQVPEETLRELKRRYLYLEELPEISAVGEWVIAAIRALAAEQLHKAGLRAVYWGFGGEMLGLLEDLVLLLRFMLHLELYGLGEAARFDAPAILRVFHAFSNAMTGCCQGVMGRLLRRVRTLLEEWH